VRKKAQHMVVERDMTHSKWYPGLDSPAAPTQNHGLVVTGLGFECRGRRGFWK
jgi:hypothetical protein